MKKKIYFGLSIFFGLGTIAGVFQAKSFIDQLGVQQFIFQMIFGIVFAGLFYWLSKKQDKVPTNQKPTYQKTAKMEVPFDGYQPTHVILKRIFDINENTGDFRVHNKEVININEITSYELVQNDNVVSSGGLGASITGGILFGGIGALVGSQVGAKNARQKINIFRIKLLTTDFNRPVLYIDLMPFGKMYTDTLIYKTTLEKADKVLSVLYNLSAKIEK